jgi:site-specific DNA recombinase
MSPKISPKAKAVAYVRVSTAEQAREGWSLGEQRKRLKAYCEARGWRLAKVYADAGVSGKGSTVRPEFDRMVSDVLADGVEVIVAMKLDRLGRSAKTLLDVYDKLERKGVAIVTIEDSIDTSTAQGRLFRTILAGVAEFEREMIVERTRTGVRAAMAAGKHVGRAPYGFKVVSGRLVASDVEQAVIRTMLGMRAKKASLRQIAKALNDKGVPCRKARGKDKAAPWYPATVARVLEAAEKF